MQTIVKGIQYVNKVIIIASGMITCTLVIILYCLMHAWVIDKLKGTLFLMPMIMNADTFIRGSRLNCYKVMKGD